MSLTRAQFVERLTASGIIAAEDVAEFERKVAAARQTSDAQAYARLLVQHGRLTKYQAAALYQGKTKGLVLGNYVLLDKLGAGGMGQVFKALHRRMDRIVALKVLPAEATKSPENVKRFHREVKAAARLEHPNIVAAHDADEADGTHFLVMQYVEGKDLSAIVKEHGPLPVAQAVECIRQAAQGLAYAHKRGVIHRDIKPANLLLDSTGTVKILDMGLARLEGQLHDAASVAGLTQSGQVMGTVDYMSPEQAEETRGVDARADQYSLGCTLWVLLTGRPMFGGTTTIAKLMAHRTAPIPSLRAARADVPEALEAVYRKMVAKEPDDRYKSMEEVIAALATCLGDAPPSSLDGPSSTDSRLTEFFQQIAATKTAAPPKSVTAIDAETQQHQPAKIETGTELRIKGEGRGVKGEQPKTSAKPLPQPAEGPSPLASRPSSRPSRKLHPLLLAAGLAVAGIGSLGILLALALWFVQPGEEPISSTASTDGVNQVEAPATSRPLAAGLQFDGIGSHVLLPAALKLPASEPATIEAIVTPHKAQQSGIVVITPQHRGGTIFAYDGKWVGRAWVVGAANYAESSLAIDEAHVGKPVHLATVWDGTRVVLYVNGKPGVQQQIVTVEDNKLDQIMLGGAIYPDGKPGWVFDGIMHQVRISNSKRYGELFTSPQQLTNDADTLALYHFDEGAGEVLRDSSGNEHHGKIVVAKWVAGERASDVADYALRFSGKESYVTGSAHLTHSRSWTVEGWITPQIPASATEHPLHVLHGACAGLHAAWKGENLHWRAYGYQGGEYQAVDSEQPIEMGRATHVAVVYNGSDLRLFVRGKLEGTPALLAALREENQSAIMPGPSDWSVQEDRHGFFGLVNEVRFSNVPRYQSDFKPEPRFQPDASTLALYHFDEGTGDVLNDSSGHEHHGKIVGAKWVKLEPSSRPNVAAALEFTPDARVELPALPLAGLSEVCVEAWVIPQRVTAAEVGIIFNADNQAGLKTTAKGNWDVVFSNGKGEWHPLGSPQQKINGRLTHVAGVLGSGRVQLYVDGKRVSYKPAPNFRLSDINKPAVIGGGWEGAIQQLRLSKIGRYNADFTPIGRLESDAHTIALYHFDDGAGDVLCDSSGNAHDGKIIGAKWVNVEPLPAPADFALEFDGKSHVDIPSLERHAAEPLTIEAWVKDVANRTAILACIQGTAPVQMHFVREGSATSPSGGERLGEGKLWRGKKSPAGVDFAAWRHLAYVIDGQAARLFVDGVQVQEERGLFAPLRPKADGRGASIGADLDVDGKTGWTMEGKVRELRISKTARYDRAFMPQSRWEPDAETLALYHCDEGAGDVLRDSSGNDHHGKIVGAKWVRRDQPPAGKFALKFDGHDDYVEAPDFPLDPVKPYTVELWATPSSRVANVVDFGRQDGFVLWCGSPEGWGMHATFSSQDGVSEIVRGKTETTQFDRLQHVAAVVVPERSSVQLYIDGVPSMVAPTRNSAAQMFVDNPALTLGRKVRKSIGSGYFSGQIQQLRVSQAARYTAQFTPQQRFSSDSDTLALYHFDEGAGDVLNDSSGNNHHGTIVGAKWVQATLATPAAAEGVDNRAAKAEEVAP